MSTTTMLQLIQQATRELGLTVPTVVAASSVTQTVNLLGLLNAVGYELLREHEWEQLSTEYRFTTVYYQYTADTTNGSTTISNLSSTTGLTTTPTYFYVSGDGINQDTYLSSVDSGAGTAVLNQAATATATSVTLTFSQAKYALPSDWDRQTNRTHWDKSKRWEMLGPETAQQWQWLKSGWISTGPRIRYRILGNLFQIWPAQSSNEYLGFEYTSKNWAAAAAGTAKSSFTVDTDTCIFDDRLMVLGLKLKFFELNGFDTTALYRDYRAQLDRAKADDAGAPTLSLSPRQASILVDWRNIPDQGYGS